MVPSIVQAISRSWSNAVITTVTSYSPRSKSRSESRSMCTTKRSSTALAGSPSADINMPDASMDTCPAGSASTSKMAAGSAAIVRSTSMRSTSG